MPHQRAGLLAAAALALESLDDIVVGSVREVHTSVADRVYDGLGRVGIREPSRYVHQGVAGAVYGGIDLALGGSTALLRHADRRGWGPSLEDHPRGRFVLSAVNGLIGDHLVEKWPELSFDVGVRHGGRDVSLDAAGIAEAFVEPTDAVVVFVHGLCESEDYWRRSPRPRSADSGEGAASYGDRLAADEGWTPVYLRANTGLPVATSGVAVHALLQRLVDVWPVPLNRIALVGHSMGGLILRAACAVSAEAEDSWTEKVTDVVTLATPHLGSPVERAIARGLGLSTRMPEMAPYTRIFSRRSGGVLDLASGMPEDAAQVPNARYHLVAGSLTRSARHPVASGIGDLLVQPRSALALPRHGDPLFPAADRLHVPCADHFALLNHGAVYDAMRDWLRHTGPRDATPHGRPGRPAGDADPGQSAAAPTAAPTVVATVD